MKIIINKTAKAMSNLAENLFNNDAVINTHNVSQMRSRSKVKNQV